MTVHVGTQSKIIPTTAGQQTKYYPVVKSTSRVTLIELAEKISRMSSLSTADVIGTVEALTTVIPEEIAMGNIIDLGSFGSFTLTVRARGCRFSGASFDKTDQQSGIKFQARVAIKSSPEEYQVSNKKLAILLNID